MNDIEKAISQYVNKTANRGLICEHNLGRKRPEDESQRVYLSIDMAYLLAWAMVKQGGFQPEDEDEEDEFIEQVTDLILFKLDDVADALLRRFCIDYLPGE